MPTSGDLKSALQFAFIIEMMKQSLSVTKNVQNVPEIVQ